MISINLKDSNNYFICILNQVVNYSSKSSESNPV